MKNGWKKYGFIGGTAAACVACCTAPLLMGPLLAWSGATALGLIFSPWFLLLLAVPVLLMLARKMSRQVAEPKQGAAGACACSTACQSGGDQDRDERRSVCN